jgi:uncharacterized protein GlcG (DUF336 family)
MNWKMNISVVDSGANQIFFEKMDGAYLASGDIAGGVAGVVGIRLA